MQNKVQYWLCIEPHVFIWQVNKSVLFYNSINFQKFFFPQQQETDTIIQKLLDPANFYSTLIPNNFQTNSSLAELVEQITKNKIGSIHTLTSEKKPIIIPPFYIFPRKLERLQKRKIEFYDIRILDYIQDITIQLSGECGCNCTACSYYYKQITHCSKSKSSFSLNDIKNLVPTLQLLNIRKINIVGGDLFSIPFMSEVIMLFQSLQTLVIYNLFYKHITSKILNLIFNNSSNTLVKILIDIDEASEEEIILLANTVRSFRKKIIWVLSVASAHSLYLSERLIQQLKIKEYEIYPIYKGDNLNFFNKYYFLNESDLFNLEVSKREIHANQVINKNFFGKVIIKSDGNIYDNENLSALGTIQDNLETLIYELINKKKSWLLIRDNPTCNQCIYKYLCPPPSNVELLLNRETICKQPFTFNP